MYFKNESTKRARTLGIRYSSSCVTKKDFLINQSRSNGFVFRKLVSDPALVPFLFRPDQGIDQLERFMTPENHSILTNSIPLLKNVLTQYTEEGFILLSRIIAHK